MKAITHPFGVFTNDDGTPLDAGYIYIGSANLNPEANPVDIFWDELMTIPAAQPVRTINGYLSQSGTPGRLFTAVTDYSMTVKDSNSVVVFTALTAAGLSATTTLPWAEATGTADAILADFDPDITPADGVTVIIRASAANATTTPTLAVDGGAAKTIVKRNNIALAVGDIAGPGHSIVLIFDETFDAWELVNPKPQDAQLPATNAGGTADALAANFTPDVTIINGTQIQVRASAANLTTTPTIAVDGGAATVIQKFNGLPLSAGDIAGAGHWLDLVYDDASSKWMLQNPGGLATSTDGVIIYTSDDTYAKPNGLKYLEIFGIGGGGGGQGGYNDVDHRTPGGGGGGGGSFYSVVVASDIGTTNTITVGTGGAGGAVAGVVGKHGMPTKFVTDGTAPILVATGGLGYGSAINTVEPTGISTCTSGGTVDAITADFTPDITLGKGLIVGIKASGANLTTTPTLAVDGGIQRTIVKFSGALAAGDIPGNTHWMLLMYDLDANNWVLLNPVIGKSLGNGGDADNGDINYVGGAGGHGSVITFTLDTGFLADFLAAGGNGGEGAGPYGAPGANGGASTAVATAPTAGAAGNNSGAGGGGGGVAQDYDAGGPSFAYTHSAGGNGAKGLVVIKEYF